MTASRRRMIGAAVLALGLAAATSGCEWRGLNSLNLPGTAAGSEGYEIQAQMPDVVNIQPNSRVLVRDVNIGTVTRIEVQNWHALVTMRIDPDVYLPANATAKVGQTTLLGSVHVELAPPTDITPEGRLGNGSVIPLAAASHYPTTEQTLASLSALLNGGGLGHMQQINQTMAKALAGRVDGLRSLLSQLDIFVTQANEQTGDIISATDSLNGLVKQFADNDRMVDNALATIPRALAILADQRRAISDAITELGRFSAVATSAATESKSALAANLRNLAPTLDALANAGPALTKSLGLFSTFPWPKDTLANWWRGDYANLTLILDMTLSRIDSSMFTGTRWEGDLTEMELQWGRTIGQLPSPYTSGNPLTYPYHHGGY